MGDDDDDDDDVGCWLAALTGVSWVADRRLTTSLSSSPSYRQRMIITPVQTGVTTKEKAA